MLSKELQEVIKEVKKELLDEKIKTNHYAVYNGFYVRRL